MRQCTKCKEFKELFEFSKDRSRKDGYSCWCKSCQKEYHQEHKVEKAKYNAKYRQEHKLEITKHRAKYYQEHKVEIAKYYQKHKVEIGKYKAKYNQEHKIEKAIYDAKYRQEHKFEIAKHVAKYQKDNPDKFNAYEAKRRALKLNQIPPGTDLKKVAKIYKLAREISEKTGIKMHVDHINPLSKGGPHCPENLQIITATENLEKGDKLPSEFYKQGKPW